jgi:hypothetical protein
MGIAIVGGLISSTLLTLVVVPAAYSYVDRFGLWSKSWSGSSHRPGTETTKGKAEPAFPFAET